MSDICGPRCSEQSGKSDPLGLLVKMLVDSSRWSSPYVRMAWTKKRLKKTRQYSRTASGTSSTASPKIWKTRDIESNRWLYRLAPSVRRTAETGCGLLPTPLTQGLKECKDGSSRPVNPALLPTPKACDGGRGAARTLAQNKDGSWSVLREKSGLRFGANLSDLSGHSLLPTPRASGQENYETRAKRKGHATVKSYLQENMQYRTGTNSPLSPPVCGGDDGLPIRLDGITLSRWRSASIKAYGNAIVPQVAYEIMKIIKHIEE